MQSAGNGPHTVVSDNSILSMLFIAPLCSLHRIKAGTIFVSKLASFGSHIAAIAKHNAICIVSGFFLCWCLAMSVKPKMHNECTSPFQSELLSHSMLGSVGVLRCWPPAGWPSL